MFCENCGNPIEAGSKFCMSCGARAEVIEESTDQVVDSSGIEGEIQDTAGTFESPAAASAPPPQSPDPAPAVQPPPPPRPAAHQPPPGPGPQPMYQASPMPPPPPMPLVNEKVRPVTPLPVWKFIGMFLLMGVPILGIVMVFVWNFSSSCNQNTKNFARALLITFIIFLVLGIVGFFTIGDFVKDIWLDYSLPF